MGRLTFRRIAFCQFATALQGQSTDTLRLVAVALEIEGSPHLLTGAPKCLHEESLGFVVCQNLLLHIRYVLLLLRLVA